MHKKHAKSPSVIRPFLNSNEKSIKSYIISHIFRPSHHIRWYCTKLSAKKKIHISYFSWMKPPTNWEMCEIVCLRKSKVWTWDLCFLSCKTFMIVPCIQFMSDIKKYDKVWQNIKYVLFKAHTKPLHGFTCSITTLISLIYWYTQIHERLVHITNSHIFGGLA